MTLKELGEQLRRERERKGLSVKQVMESTKISRRILVAIEEGDRANLPHPVYAKGFIRNYARLLDLNQDELLDAVAQEFNVEDEEERQYSRATARRAVAGSAPAPAANGRRIWPTVLLIAILVAVLAAMVVYLQRRGALSAHGPAAPQTQEQAAAPAVAPAAPEAPAPVQEQAEAPASEPAPALPAPVPVQEPPRPVAQEAAKPAAQEQAQPHPGAKVLTVVAKPGQMCWMEVSVDGADKKEFFIRSGESVRFEYAEKLWIKLGNVGGVNVTHNGKAVITDGAGWSVKTLTFP
jgi:cytoskeleton protein RodZ